jgi:hypothetical protein
MTSAFKVCACPYHVDLDRLGLDCSLFKCHSVLHILFDTFAKDFDFKLTPFDEARGPGGHFCLG